MHKIEMRSGSGEGLRSDSRGGLLGGNDYDWL